MRIRTVMVAMGLLAGCEGSAAPEPSLSLANLPTTITLAVGESRQIGGSSVRFESVRSDSRCPVDVTCVWAGNAELAIAVGPVAGDGPEHALRINTDVEPRSGTARGLVVTIVELAPAPVSTRPTDGYRVELRIDRGA